MTTRDQLWVTCGPCKWTWSIAFLPMEVTKLAQLMMGAHCPKCGGKKNIGIALEAEIVSAERGGDGATIVMESRRDPIGKGEAPWPAF